MIEFMNVNVNDYGDGLIDEGTVFIEASTIVSISDSWLGSDSCRISTKDGSWQIRGSAKDAAKKIVEYRSRGMVTADMPKPAGWTRGGIIFTGSNNSPTREHRVKPIKSTNGIRG